MKLTLTQITVASLIALSVGGFFYGQTKKKQEANLFPDSESLFKDVEFKKPMKVEAKIEEPADKEADKAPPVATANISNEKSVSRRVALEQVAKGNYFGSIVSETEGFKKNLYNDNTGYAIGNGWNVSLQSTATNKMVSTGIGMSESDSQALVALSGVLNPQALPGVAITPEQATKAVQLMRAQYEEPMRKLVPSFDRLQRNEQDTLVYHAYKVGAGGAAKYKGMLSALKAYDSSPSEANKLKVADTFTYTYKLNGKVMTDDRAKLYLAALFTSPEAYLYLIGRTPAPANFASVAKLAKQKIDTSKPADDQIQDDFGKAKEEFIRQGKPLEVIFREPKVATPVDYGRRGGVISDSYLF